MTQSTSITAVLVAGPETRHLRVPKQTLPFGDTTVLGRTMRAYLDAGVSQIVLVLGYKADQIGNEIGPLPPNVRIARNPLFDEGISSFLRAGAHEIPAGSAGFCVGLQDQPLLTPEQVDELMKAFIDGKKKIMVPLYQGLLGLPVFFQPEVAAEFAAMKPREEIWDILVRNSEDVLDHPTGCSSVVRSIDDLDDYYQLLTIAGLPIPEIPAAVRKIEESAQETVTPTEPAPTEEGEGEMVAAETDPTEEGSAAPEPE